MHLRPAEPSDLSATASMSVDAFWEDELYNYTNIWREKYPEHFRDHFLRQHHLRYWSAGHVFHVAVTDEGDVGHFPGQGEKVVGYAIWQRRGTSQAAKRWQKQTPWALLEQTLFEASNYYYDLIRADKSLNYNRLHLFITEATQDFDAISDMWKLRSLCVDPRFQRRGIGSMMIQWGQEQAQKEGCPIGVESSFMARNTYQKNGFRVYGKTCYRDSLAEVVPIFIWEPSGMEGEWGMQEEK